MAERLPPSRRIGEQKRKPPDEKPLRPPARIAEVEAIELHELAEELSDEWQCSGPLRLWKRDELESYVSRASDLAEMVLDSRKKC